MPIYKYSGFNKAGKRVSATLDAENHAAVRQILQGRGIFVESVSEGKARSGDIDLGATFEFVTLGDISIMTRQLATLSRAGIPLIESLTAITEQAEKVELKRVLSDIRRQVNEGSSLAAALSQHPKRFSDLYINMVRAGESAGNLDVVLDRLTEFLDNQMALRSKIIQALAYPALMTLVGGGIMAFLLAVVVPKVTQIFEDQGDQLPAVTRLLLFFSDAFAIGWFIIIPALIAAIWGFLRWRSSPNGKHVWDRFLLRVPIVQGLIRMLAVARFARTLGTLLASGVPLLTALGIVKDILGNTVLIDVIEDVRVHVREGDSVAAPLKRSGQFPPLMIHMVAIGEKTGNLEGMLENVADNYDRQVDARLQTATALLEPLMIVAMGVAVAFVVFAIMLPILQMNQAVGG